MKPKVLPRLLTIIVVPFILFSLLNYIIINQSEQNKQNRHGQRLHKQKSDTFKRDQTSNDTKSVTKFRYIETRHSNLIRSEKYTLKFHTGQKFAYWAGKNGFKPLPDFVAKNPKTYVYFIGPSRSSHSIIGSFIDAHEKAIIAEEFDFFKQAISKPNLFRSKSDIAQALWEGSWLAVNGGTRNETFKGYSLNIPNLYNGCFKKTIDLIGDKEADLTLLQYSTKPAKFRNVLEKLQNWFQVKVIFVVRNPFDNVATKAMYEYIDKILQVTTRGTDHIRKLKRVNACEQNSTETGLNTGRILDRVLKIYINDIEKAMQLIREIEPDLKVVYVDKFIKNPQNEMQNLCEFLNLDCSLEYLEKVAQKTFSSESKSRCSIFWPLKQKLKLENFLQKYPQYFRDLNFND